MKWVTGERRPRGTTVMLALSVFSAVTCALASLAPGRVPPLDAPATPEAILRAADAMRGGG